ncbi:HEPN domain-containing protein [Sphingomonas cannabina]|uniref:HEPN domain-containing protein n=1 Tax=Sphingomonas cannabina TaxID=2899123 RepID=UPI001F27BCDE|nr:HEPN domain-containing protein [Sphingomonas cannabina]UIJ44765.1 HEPN domain-containing protein [Sphingomonas cannabina]
MRSDIDHLPQRQQDELERVKRILMDEFAVATSRATQPWKRNGKILKIILFGSYARDDWVDEPENGYQSDFDILVIVSHKELTEIADYWYVAEDKILRDPEIGRLVNIIVHTMDEVNDALARGEYFWVDVARDGIALYELPGFSLASPQPLTPADAYKLSSSYLERQLPSADEWLELAGHALSKGNAGEWPKKAAFNLHQATETLYVCFLLVWTFYSPRSHNIKFLRSFAEERDQRLIDAWPRATRVERRRFELLKRAYVDARYSDAYEISMEDLAALSQSVERLRSLVDEICQERVAELRTSAGI